MIRRPPRSTRTDTLFPYTTLFRSSARFDACAGTIHEYSGATVTVDLATTADSNLRIQPMIGRGEPVEIGLVIGRIPMPARDHIHQPVGAFIPARPPHPGRLRQRTAIASPKPVNNRVRQVTRLESIE